jgi:transcription initiation factor TFIID subunit 7
MARETSKEIDPLPLPPLPDLQALQPSTMVVLKLNLASLPKPASRPTASSPPRQSSSSGVLPIPRIRVKSAASASTKIRIRNQKDVGLGYDSEASDREEDPSIEEQIILRCRPGDDAEYLRGCLERKEVPDVSIKFKGIETVPSHRQEKWDAL